MMWNRTKSAHFVQLCAILTPNSCLVSTQLGTWVGICAISQVKDLRVERVADAVLAFAECLQEFRTFHFCTWTIFRLWFVELFQAELTVQLEESDREIGKHCAKQFLQPRQATSSLLHHWAGRLGLNFDLWQESTSNFLLPYDASSLVMFKRLSLIKSDIADCCNRWWRPASLSPKALLLRLETLAQMGIGVPEVRQ